VVGVVLDDARRALVNPLVTKCVNELTASRFVPFAAPMIQSLLIRVCEELAPSIPGTVPEVFGFHFEESLRQPCEGSSLDIAGLLSAIDALTERSCDVFAGACALVTPEADDSLAEVACAREKLEAFLREYGRGRLLVISSVNQLGVEARAAFDEVWEVDSISGLARRLSQLPGVLTRLARPESIASRQMGLVLARLRYLDESRQNKRVVDLCQRLNSSRFDKDVLLYDRIRVLNYESDSVRHIGSNQRALKSADKLKALLNDFVDVVSDDGRLTAAVQRAAALFDCCDFQGARDELANWLTVCDRDPRRFTGQARVELFNTAARTRVMLQEAGWEELFHRSILIQEKIDPGSIRRTEGYLIQGYCRAGLFAEAEILLVKHEAALTRNLFADGFTHQFRCDLERRKGTVYPRDPDELTIGAGYPRAFARLAMARQHGRAVDQVLRLLRGARGELEKIVAEFGCDDNILRLIAHAVALTEVAIAEDRAQWTPAAQQFASYVRKLGAETCSYFGPPIARLVDGPSIETTEQLLGLLPYI
jgi:hypothetical protein